MAAAAKKKVEEPKEEENKHTLHLGLGEVVQRLMRIAIMRSQGIYIDETLAAEEGMMTSALNLHSTLDLGFDCNMDGVPDDITIFATSAETSCCRIVSDTTKRKTRGKSRASW